CQKAFCCLVQRLLESCVDYSGHLLCEVVGGAKVLTVEAHLTLDNPLTQHLAVSRSKLDFHLNGSRSSYRGDLTLFLAACLETLIAHAQDDEIGHACGGAIAAAIDMLKLLCLV